MAKSWSQKRSKLQEQRIAEDIGGRIQAGSGSSWRAKSDVRDFGKLRIEAKFTSKSSYILKLHDILKIRSEALRGGLELWAMQIEFVGGSKQKYAVIDHYSLLELRQRVPRACTETYVGTENRQFKMDLDELRSCAGQAGISGTDWSLHLDWVHCGIKVAIIDWDYFLSLYEAEPT